LSTADGGNIIDLASDDEQDDDFSPGWSDSGNDDGGEHDADMPIDYQLSTDIHNLNFICAFNQNSFKFPNISKKLDEMHYVLLNLDCKF
jgi:hypothetical protein